MRPETCMPSLPHLRVLLKNALSFFHVTTTVILSLLEVSTLHSRMNSAKGEGTPPLRSVLRVHQAARGHGGPISCSLPQRGLLPGQGRLLSTIQLHFENSVEGEPRHPVLHQFMKRFLISSGDVFIAGCIYRLLSFHCALPRRVWLCLLHTPTFTLHQDVVHTNSSVSTKADI